MTWFLKRGEKDIESPKKIDFFAFFLAPLFILIMLEIMHLANFAGYRLFFGNAFFVVKWLFSYVFLLLFQCVLLVIIPNFSIAHTIEMIFFFLIATASEILLKVTGTPLLPSDFLLLQNMGEISGFVEIPLLFQCVLSLLFACFSIIYFFRRGKKRKSKLNIWQKIAFSLVGVILFTTASYGMCFNRIVKYRFFEKCKITIGAFNPRDDYYSNGFILTFFPRIGELVFEKPEGYSEEKIKELKDKENEDVLDGGVKANVIAIQNEALWDVTRLPDTEFSKDPLKNIRKIGKEKNAASGTLISPVFGGGTCMPEFEFITGFSTVFFPASVYPYIQAINRPTDSLVTCYKENGYETFALHTYKKNFYSRDKAYPLLGFDTYLGDADLNEPEYKGLFISDMEVTRQLISAYENKQSDRIFAYAVTMQNHGGYTYGRYSEYDVTATNPNLDETDSLIVQEYTQGVYDADVAFAALVDYFRKVDEPTIIVMYGDHLPLLGDNGVTYLNSGYIDAEVESFKASDYPCLYETPYIVWANYNVDMSNIADVISPANLGISVCNIAGVENLPWYYSNIKNFYAEYPVYSPYTVQNNEYSDVESEENRYEDMATEYEYIQYDILHGNNYVKQ